MTQSQKMPAVNIDRLALAIFDFGSFCYRAEEGRYRLAVLDEYADVVALALEAFDRGKITIAQRTAAQELATAIANGERPALVEIEAVLGVDGACWKDLRPARRLELARAGVRCGCAACC